MSGLLERIVRRRRASASSRLGPPTQNGHPSPFEVPYLNGREAELPVLHMNGAVGAVEVSGPAEVESEALDALEAERVVADEPERVVADEPEPVVADEPEPKPEPADPPMPEPGFRERGRIRRRARYLRRLREVQLRDIGGFMLELHRFGRERPDLVQTKIAGAARTDAELRALHQALGAEEPLRELREAGIGGGCNNCAAVHGSADRFCATCGEPLRRYSQAGRSPEFGTYFTRG